MGEPSIDALHDPYEDQLSAARFKAERDAAVQELQGLRERNLELWMDCGMEHELTRCAEDKAERLGKLVWRLQNRLARSHRREKALRKGMREWREKVIGAPVRTVSAYDLLPEDDLQTLRWVREQGGLDALKAYTDCFSNLLRECHGYRDLAREYSIFSLIGHNYVNGKDVPTHLQQVIDDESEKMRPEIQERIREACRKAIDSDGPGIVADAVADMLVNALTERGE